MTLRGKNAARNALHANPKNQAGLSVYHPIGSTHEVHAFGNSLRAAVLDIFNSSCDVPVEVNDYIAPVDDGLEPIAYFGEEQPPTYPFRHIAEDTYSVPVMSRKLGVGGKGQKDLRWSRQDIGAITGDIVNELSQVEYPATDNMTLVNVVRVGDPSSKNEGRQLALVPEADSYWAEVFCREHEIVVNGLSKRLQRFKYPSAEPYVPVLKIGTITREANRSTQSAIVGAVREQLPLSVTVMPLQFRADQVITTNPYMKRRNGV